MPEIFRMDVTKVESTSQPKRTRKPTEEKNVQLKENSTGKRKYVRRKAINKTPTISAEETIIDLTQNSTKKSCKSNSPEAQPIEKTNKKRGLKKKMHNKSYPTEATIGLSETLIRGPNTRSRSSKKFKEESSTDMMNIVYSHDTQVQNTLAKRMRYSRRNATNKVSYDHELSTEDIKISNNKNKRDQAIGNEESPNTSDRNIIGVHHNDLSLYRTKIETASTSATTNLNEAEMTFSPQDVRRLDYASNSDSSEYNSDYDNFISRVRSCEELNFSGKKGGIFYEQISEDAVDKSLGADMSPKVKDEKLGEKNEREMNRRRNMCTSKSKSLSDMSISSQAVLISEVSCLPMNAKSMPPPVTNSSERDFRNCLKSFWNCSKYALCIDTGLVLVKYMLSHLSASSPSINFSGT
ncbi:hypothetical protein Ahy_A03g016309 [Arachis hypogaea]|uniref:Uncharacterized protein n=1 Tax=Arachis hypogaea TaxID=3818 RepID=A0A445E2U1_ARAHY|nr:hypothetical protein Ahy_A03g016309 [Arachis hypogaea]